MLAAGKPPGGFVAGFFELADEILEDRTHPVVSTFSDERSASANAWVTLKSRRFRRSVSSMGAPFGPAITEEFPATSLETITVESSHLPAAFRKAADLLKRK